MDITITLTISVPDGAGVELGDPALKVTPGPALRNTEPEPEPEAPAAEPEQPAQEIKDPELLTAMSNAAEKVGAEAVKNIVKQYASEGGVRHVEQKDRPALMEALKEAIGVEQPAEAAPEQPKASAEQPAKTAMRPRRG